MAKWQELGYKNVGSYNRAVDPKTGVAPSLVTPVSPVTATPDIKQLESTIKSGNFSASDARAYNKATGNQQGARDLALGSQKAVNNMQTSVTADLQGVTKEEFKQDAGNNKPTSTTDITYNEDKTAYDTNKVISKAPQFTGADGKTYQTVRNSDNTLTTIDVTTGQAVTGKYTDAEREGIKQGFLASPEDNQKKQEEAMKYDPNTLFTQIQSGIEVSQDVKNSSEYQKQLARSDDLNRYSKKTAPDLSKDIMNGKLITGSQVYNDLKLKNPQLIADAEKLASLNGVLVNDDGSKTKNTQISITDTISRLLKPSDIPKVSEALSKDEDINTWNTEMADIEDQMKEKKRALQTLKKDIEKEFEGTGATRGYVNSIISERSEQITNDYNNLLDDYNTTASKLERKTKLIADDINYQKQAEADNLKKLEFVYGIQKDELDYQRGLDAETRKLEQAYQYQYGDLNSTNPTLQNIAVERAVADMYAKYPIPGMESQSAKVQKVKDRMAQGMTGTEAIASVENEIRSSQRYQDYLASEKAKITPKATESWQKLTDGSLYNQATGEIKSVGATGIGGATGDLRGLASQFPGQAWAKNNNPAGITWNANFDNPKPGTTAYALQQAGVNFSKGTARPSAEGGNYVTFDTIEDGLLAQQIMMTQTYGNSTVNQMLQKWVGTKEGPNYAKQVAGNAGVDLNTKVSDLSQEQLASLQMAKIQKESPGLYKLLNSGGGDGNETTTNTIMAAWDGKDIKKLAENLGVDVATAKSQYDTWKQGNKLDAQDTIILGSFLKDISGTAVSKEERAIYEAQYLDMKKRGLSTQEIKNQLALFVPTPENANNQSVKNQLSQLQKYASKLGVKASETMATLINQGDYKGAIQELENASYAQKKIDTKSISDAGSLIKKGNDLKAKITEYEKSFGPIQQWTTKAIVKFSDDPNVQGMLGDMANFVAKYRNEIAGSAITTGEAGFLEPLIADIKDNPKNAIAKVNSIQKSLVNEINTVRDQVGLPKLNDWRSFYDINLRSQAYKGTSTPAKTPVPPAVKTEIIKTSNGKTYNINF